jgi:hypothetical protein
MPEITKLTTLFTDALVHILSPADNGIFVETITVSFETKEKALNSLSVDAEEVAAEPVRAMFTVTVPVFVLQSII